MQELSQQVKPTSSRHQRKNRKNRRRWLARLTEMWPQTFDLKNPRPLAVDIFDAMSAELNAAGKGGHGEVRFVLKGYINNIRYVKALAVGGLRYNLRGEPEGEVTPEQQQRAAETLKTMLERKVQFADEVKP
ncbi:ProQ/FINO family protein [Klebsiella aerogenes]|uniref:ProQ/FINO family protein n=1 Tax=Klebsiella aerogenes TaxID=548 RepID=UPI001F47B2F7|nr:ProQ/FINO family protein [Klebsiella aerogenes]